MSRSASWPATGDVEQPANDRDIADEQVAHHHPGVGWALDGPELHEGERDEGHEQGQRHGGDARVDA